MNSELRFLLAKMKAVVFDFDGVLSVFQTTENKVCVYPDETYINFCIDNSPYKYSRAPKNMQKYVSSIGTDRTYVLSAVSSSFEADAKMVFIKINYPEIAPEHIIFVKSGKDKIRVLQSSIFNIFKDEEIAMVEDDLGVIESIETVSNIRCLHISHFID